MSDLAKAVLISGRDEEALRRLCVALSDDVRAEYVPPAQALARLREGPDHWVVVLDESAAAQIPAKEAGSLRTVMLVIVGPDRHPSLDPRLVHGLIREPIDVSETARLIRACIAVREGRVRGAMCAAAAFSSVPLLVLLAC